MALQLHQVEISTEDELESAFAAMNRAAAQALIVLTDPILFGAHR
jgi:hypothetical protein